LNPDQAIVRAVAVEAAHRTLVEERLAEDDPATEDSLTTDN
jgi:hypothetical protein